MCYTSGTTGQPKGVLYSHRAIAIHSLASTQSGTLGISRAGHRAAGRADVPRQRVGLPVHVHARRREAGLPRPAPRPAEPARRVRRRSSVTVTGGRADDLARDPAAARREARAAGTSRGCAAMIVGGSAAPQVDDRGLREAPRPARHPRLGHDRDGAARHRLRALVDRERALAEDEQFAYRAKQGLPAPFVEIRARGAEGLVPWDGADDGRARGARRLDRVVVLRRDESQADRWTDDGWFKTGDIVTIEPTRLHRDPGPLEGPGQVRRRVDLDRRAGERADGPSGRGRGGGDRRPRREVGRASARGRRAPRGRRRRRPRSCASSSRRSFAKWWLPDGFEFVPEIPKTAVGKFRKTALRDQFAKQQTPA